MTYIDIILTILVLLFIALPTLLLSLELFLGQRRPIKNDSKIDSRLPCTILMPAHNEELIIKKTLVQLKKELLRGDRVIVIADNCSDNTASICQSLNVEVIERYSEDKRGKGFALDFGVKHILNDMPKTVVILDADSEFEPGGLDALVSRSQDSNAVVQAMYLMRSPLGAPIKTRVAEFAWLVKNRIRPAGLARLGLGCHLQGSGMAFPKEVFDKVSLASGNIVEDLELGLKLTALGYKIYFEANSTVNSIFPTSADGLDSQRTRWEHGHLASISMLPKMVWSAFKKKQYGVIGLSLDAAIPPTIIWLIILFLSSLFSSLITFLSIYTPFYVLSVCLLILFISLLIIWLRHGLSLIKVTDIWGIIKFIVSKFSIYKAFFTARQKEWVRTDRAGTDKCSKDK